MKIILATGNKNKIREFKDKLGVEIEGVNSEAEENGITFAENALIKARDIWNQTGGIVIADDSGVCVDALNGQPGVISARFSGKGDKANNELLLEKLDGIEDRKAHFVCSLAIIFADGKEEVIEVKWEGKIAHSIAGNEGFGYDKVFIPNGYTLRASEISLEEKNKISHRGQAIEKLCETLKANGLIS